MNPKERGKDRQWSNGRYYPGTWLKETHKKISVGIQAEIWNRNFHTRSRNGTCSTAMLESNIS